MFSAQLENSLLFGCFVSISRTLYSLFSSIVVLVSRRLLEFSSVRPFCVFIELCYARFFCLQLVCCVSILRSICSLLISIVALRCCTFLEFCKVCFLRQESLTFLVASLVGLFRSILCEVFDGVSRALRIKFKLIVPLVSRAP